MMVISSFFRTLCIILIGVSIVFILYKNLNLENINSSRQSKSPESNSLLVKNFLLKYKKPQRVEIQSLVKNADNIFSNDIENIQKLKIFLDSNSNYYIEMQLFTDENDPDAPLVVQCRFLDVKTKNLIQEKSLNLFH
jgi:hypothetical protein